MTQTKTKENEKKFGLDVPMPKEKCENDVKCPFHGNLKLHGRTFTGTVIKKDTHKTVNVEWARSHYIPKYERYEKRRSRVKAHNPKCIDAQVGDKVKIMECRKLSKTKSFVVLQKIK